MYKYNEFTEEEFKHYDERYSGDYTYLTELPDRTAFRIQNGAWEAKVIHKEGDVYLQTTLNDELCKNGENQMKLSVRDAAWIKILNQ